MPVIAPLIIGGATLASGLIGANAAKSAANQQQQAAMAGLKFQQDVYNKNTANMQPWIQAGGGAVNSLAQLYGLPGSGNENRTLDWNQFLQSPDYQFSLQEGMRALDMSRASQGLLQSGGTARAAHQYGQGLAGTQFGNYYNRLLSLSGQGLQGASALSGVGTQAASGIANSLAGYGQAGAAGTVGGANAITGALGSGVNNLLLYSQLNKSPSGYGMVGAPPLMYSGDGSQSSMGGGFGGGVFG